MHAGCALTALTVRSARALHCARSHCTTPAQGVAEVRAGITNGVFKKTGHKNQEERCLSLVTAERTLDLETHSTVERDQFVYSFRRLVAESKERAAQVAVKVGLKAGALRTPPPGSHLSRLSCCASLRESCLAPITDKVPPGAQAAADAKAAVEEGQ